MELAIKLADLNVRNKTGGPFGAVIFEKISGRVISCGVNAVVSNQQCLAHAETMAILAAQSKLGDYNLRSHRFKDTPFELATSTEPCAMCLGAITWSGISSVISGATDEDARALGFDEGPKPTDWFKELESRRISVLTGVLKGKADEVMKRYIQDGGVLYNGD